MKNRRSIKKYKDNPIKIHDILEEALNTPSSCNRKPWRLIVVDDKELLKKMSTFRGKDNQMILGAPISVIVIADTRDYTFSEKYPNDNVWIEDCAALSMNIHLAAHYKGLGSCWLQVRHRMRDEQLSASDYLKELFNLKEYEEVASIVTIGEADEEKEANIIDTSVVSYNLDDVYFK